MASSRRPRSADRPQGAVPLAAAEQFLRAAFPGERLHGERIAAGLSGGLDSVVLLHILVTLAPRFGYAASAIHVNHGLSPNARQWERFCRRLCRDLRVPLSVKRVSIGAIKGRGLEAAAREARRAALQRTRAGVIALAHHLDDQAETVVLNLLRGAGIRGASGMRAQTRLGSHELIRPLLEVPRELLLEYAASRELRWIEDESNQDESLRRNFIRRQVGPLLATRYPRWRESLARAARHFAGKQAQDSVLLREFLALQGLRAPGERQLIDMLRQLNGARDNANVAIAHDGAVLRRYRGRALIDTRSAPRHFEPVALRGEKSVLIPELGGELRFVRRRGVGIDPAAIEGKLLTVRARSGGERLQLDPRRPHRTLKNLFQEAGIPPWERERLPLLFCGETLLWAAGLGVQAAFAVDAASPGLLPEWRPGKPSARHAANPR